MSARENEWKAGGGFKALKRLRIDSGMKQSELAEALGVSKYTVSAWERGIQIPSWGHLAAIAWIFNTDIGGLARDLGLGEDAPGCGIPLESLTDEQTPVDQMIVISKILHLFTLLDEQGKKTVKTAFEMSEYPPPKKNQNASPIGQKAGKEADQMRESMIEKAFVDAVRAEGGMAMKFTSQTMNGVPDRLILFMIGKCAFVELKAPGKQMRPLQRKRRKELEELGFPVFCVDSMEQIQPVIEALKKWSPGDPIPTGVGAQIPEIRMRELPGEKEEVMPL